jgi:hypothetical protein
MAPFKQVRLETSKVIVVRYCYGRILSLWSSITLVRVMPHSSLVHNDSLLPAKSLRLANNLLSCKYVYVTHGFLIIFCLLASSSKCVSILIH